MQPLRNTTSERPDRFDFAPQQGSELIESILSNSMDGMLVNHIPGTNASAADLNFEATNPFGDEADAFVGVRLQSYDVVQGWLTVLKPESNDVACAKRYLKAALGVDGEIIDRLPLRRSEDPLRPSEQRETTGSLT